MSFSKMSTPKLRLSPNSHNRNIKKIIARNKEVRKRDIKKADNSELRKKKYSTNSRRKPKKKNNNYVIDSNSNNNNNTGNKKKLAPPRRDSIEEEILHTATIVAKKREMLEKFQTEKKEYEARKLKLEQMLAEREATLIKMQNNRNTAQKRVNLMNNEMYVTQKKMLDVGGKNSEMRKRLEQMREEVKNQRAQAASLDGVIQDLRKSKQGNQRMIERQQANLNEKKQNKMEMENERSELLRETISINNKINEEEKQLTLLNRSSSENLKQIDVAEQKNQKLTRNVIHKARQINRKQTPSPTTSTTTTKINNPDFDVNAFNAKEEKVNAIINGNNSNGSSSSSSSVRLKPKTKNPNNNSSSKRPTEKPIPRYGNNNNPYSNLQPLTLQRNPGTSNSSNNNNISPISIHSDANLIVDNNINSNNDNYMSDGDDYFNNIADYIPNNNNSDPLSPNVMEGGGKKKPKPNRPSALLMPDDINDYETHVKPPLTPVDKRHITTQACRIWLESMDIDPSDGNISWQKGVQIGRGGNASVYQAMNRDTGIMIAVKELDMRKLDLTTVISPKDNDTNSPGGIGINRNKQRERLASKSNSKIAMIRKEIKIMKKLSHQNIVKYLGTDILLVNNRPQMYILMEYVSGGSLQNMYREWGPINTRRIRIYARQILHGLQYLHNFKFDMGRHTLLETTLGDVEKGGIIHRDIKCANILINENGVVKLADFGCSQIFVSVNSISQNSNNELLGTIPWMAPEAINHAKEHVGRKSDIWSFGCTIIEMATARHPWPKSNNIYSIMHKVASTDATPEIPESLGEMGATFLQHCFRRNQSSRWSAGHLLEDDFVKLTEDELKDQHKQTIDWELLNSIEK